MLTGISTKEKKQRVTEMKFFLRQNGVKKFSTEPFHVQRAYKRLLQKLQEKTS
jgi:hypothetical protein